MDRLKEASGWTPLGLTEDADGDWRWDSDGALGPVPQYGINGTCARLKTNDIFTHHCKSRINFVCQFC